MRWLNQWQLKGFLKNKTIKVSNHKLEEYIAKNWWNSCVSSKGFNKICLYNNKYFKVIKMKPKNRMDTIGALLIGNNWVLRIQPPKFKINIKVKNQKKINNKKDWVKGNNFSARNNRKQKLKIKICFYNKNKCYLLNREKSC